MDLYITHIHTLNLDAVFSIFMTETGQHFMLKCFLLGRFELFNGCQPLVKRWDGNDPALEPTSNAKTVQWFYLAVGQASNLKVGNTGLITPNHV